MLQRLLECHIILTTITQDMEDVYLGRDDDMDEDGEIEYGDEIGSDHTSETSQDDDDDGHADGILSNKPRK
jgi:hypothetical protein